MRVAEALYHAGRHAGAIIGGLKTALACQGIGTGRMAEPFGEMPAARCAEMDRHLQEIHTLVKNLR